MRKKQLKKIKKNYAEQVVIVKMFTGEKITGIMAGERVEKEISAFYGMPFDTSEQFIVFLNEISISILNFEAVKHINLKVG